MWCKYVSTVLCVYLRPQYWWPPPARWCAPSASSLGETSSSPPPPVELVPPGTGWGKKIKWIRKRRETLGEWAGVCLPSLCLIRGELVSNISGETLAEESTHWTPLLLLYRQEIVFSTHCNEHYLVINLSLYISYHLIYISLLLPVTFKILFPFPSSLLLPVFLLLYLSICLCLHFSDTHFLLSADLIFHLSPPSSCAYIFPLLSPFVATTRSSSPLCLLRLQVCTLQWRQAVYSLSPSCLALACCQVAR